MKALSALLVALATLVSSHALAQQIPNMVGDYVVVPGECNFIGLGNIQSASIANAQTAGGEVIVLKLVGDKTGEIGFQTVPSRVPNPNQQQASQVQFYDTDVSISQAQIAITNTIHDEYADGHKELEANISLILDGPQLQFIANEAGGQQELCNFARSQ